MHTNRADRRFDTSPFPDCRNSLKIDSHAVEHVECRPMSHSLRSSRTFPKLDEATEQLQTKLLRLVGETIGEYGLIEDGDKIMVCLSGGKDSYALLDLLLVLQRRAPIHFDLVAVNLDQKQPGFPAHILPDYLSNIGVPFHIEERDTYSIVKRLIPEGQTTCSLCSRLRRGHLYRVATELGATKIALGHHRDDIVETLFLNLFYTGKLKTMPPKLLSKDGRHVVIRPLAAVRESDLARYADLRAFPIIPCDLCGSQEDLKRKQVKEFLREWEKRSPGCTDSMFAALSNVAPPLLLDRRLFDFEALRVSDQTKGDEDAWLDNESNA
jgi:tRNA 2-thiocytidine biosynthesis protein TtcA